jgi:hypothetical protein
MKVWKIVNQKGLFSEGRAYGIDFTDYGKEWRSLKSVKQHVWLVERYRQPREKFVYEDCDIVNYEVQLRELERTSVAKICKAKI